MLQRAGALIGFLAGSVLRIRRAHVEVAVRRAGIDRPAQVARAMYASLVCGFWYVELFEIFCRALSTMKPAIELLSAAPSPQDADAAPCARLYRPVPRVRSAITMKNSAPKIPAPIPSSTCIDTRAYGFWVSV